MSTPGTINVEYAKSSRASCRKCKLTIGAGSLRVGPMVQSYMGDFLVPMWHHFKCFKVSKYISSYKGMDQLAGMDSLKAEDQIKLRELVEGASSTNTAVPSSTTGKKKPLPKKKRRRGSSSDDSSSSDSSSSSDEEDTKQPKARQGAKSEADAELIRQSDEVWKWRRRIASTLGNSAIRYILEINNQPTTGTRFGGIDAIQTRLAEAFVYGVLPKCSVCKGGDLVYTSTPQEGSMYVCTGYLDEYALCGASHPLHTIQTTAVLPAPSSTSASKGGALVREGSKYKASSGELDAIFKDYTHKPPPTRISIHSTTGRTNSGVVKVDSVGGSTEVVVPSSAMAEVADPPTNTTSKVAALLAHCQSRNNNNSSGAKALEGQVVIFAGRRLQETQKALGAQVKKLGGTTTTNPSEATLCICGEDVVTDAKKQGASATTKPSQIIHTHSVPCLREVFLSAASKGGAIPTTQAALEELLHTDCPSNLFSTPTIPLQQQPHSTTTIPISNKSGLGAAAVPLRSFAAMPAGSRSSGPRVVKVQAAGAIDPESGLDDGSATIYSPTGSERDGYNVTLSVVNIQTGQNGFYILQLIQHGKKFTVFRRWGRVGNDRIGGNKATVYHSIHPAQTEFCAVFLEKSGNDWNHLSDKAKEAGPPSTRGTFFVKRVGKGVLVETDYSSTASPFDGLDDNNNSYKGQLTKPTQELMRLIFDIKAMQSALKELHIDTEKMPLGKLSRSSIANGYSALSEIETILVTPAPQENDTVATHHRHTKIISLSNKFFSFVPHVMENEASPILNTTELVTAKTSLLNELLDLCTAYETAMKPTATSIPSSSSASSPVDVHPVDDSYKKLNTDLSEVPPSSDEFKRIAAYVKDTHGPTHTAYRLELQDLWSVERVDEAKRFEPHAANHNRQLLWHGSRVTNWGGILSQGLRIAPPEAPVTGYMFGKGVYFADVVSKSANYCSTSREHNTGLMALCEVALGDMSQLKRAKYVTKLPTGCESTMGVGRYHPDPQGTWSMENGCQVPAGKTCKAPGGKDSDLLYNEYIVYDVSQIRTKYLLKLKFVYL